MKISSILATKSREIITIGPDEAIRQAVRLLTRHRIGSLVVVDAERQVAGIITERDIIWRAAEDEALFDLPVREIMTREVITAVPQDDIMSVAHTMTERRFRHLPIIDRGRLVGIVSIGDLVKFQRDQYRGEIDTLEAQILADDALADG